jgi:hypothetical protein
MLWTAFTTGSFGAYSQITSMLCAGLPHVAVPMPPQFGFAMHGRAMCAPAVGQLHTDELTETAVPPHAPTFHELPSHARPVTAAPVRSAWHSVLALAPEQLTPAGSLLPRSVIFDYVPVSVARKLFHAVQVAAGGDPAAK